MPIFPLSKEAGSMEDSTNQIKLGNNEQKGRVRKHIEVLTIKK
jgi:hypothetical protein